MGQIKVTKAPIEGLYVIEPNSHARLACYTMNKTGVASGSFS